MNINKISRLEPDYQGMGLRVGIAVSRFNNEIGETELAACTAELLRLGVTPCCIEVITVPGALELPITLNSMAQTRRFDALVALGCIIRGETYHFEVVSNESARGINKIQLKTGIPIANGVLTTENDAQAHARMEQKGKEAAQVAIEMANLLKKLNT